MIGFPLGSLPLGRSLGRSEIEQELDREILLETCLLFFPSLSGIYSCSGDIDLDSLGVLSLYILIGILTGLLWYRSGDLEFSRDLDQEIVRALGVISGDHEVDGFGYIGLILVSYYGDSIVREITW